MRRQYGGYSGSNGRNTALRSLDEMLIYLYVSSAFASVSSLDFGGFGGSLIANGLERVILDFALKC